MSIIGVWGVQGAGMSLSSLHMTSKMKEMGLKQLYSNKLGNFVVLDRDKFLEEMDRIDRELEGLE